MAEGLAAGEGMDMVEEEKVVTLGMNKLELIDNQIGLEERTDKEAGIKDKDRKQDTGDKAVETDKGVRKPRDREVRDMDMAEENGTGKESGSEMEKELGEGDQDHRTEAEKQGKGLGKEEMLGVTLGRGHRVRKEKKSIHTKKEEPKRKNRRQSKR